MTTPRLGVVLLSALLGTLPVRALLRDSDYGGQDRSTSPDASRGIAAGCESVIVHGAVGDGAHDDTASFNAAAQAASLPSHSGCVMVPPVAPGKGYVLTGTVTIPIGVALVGNPAGLPVVPWCYAPPYDTNSTGGARILARPKPSPKSAAVEPLFLLYRGCTVRGLMILYDQMPYPTDSEFTDPTSPFYYSGGFAEATAKFVEDHVPNVGPTFLVFQGTRVVIEDVVGSRFRDFIHFGSGAGMSHIRRIHGWGYGTLVKVPMAADVLSFDTLRFTVNAGPNCLGHVPKGNFTWLPGVVALQPDNVGLWMGRCDGYVARDLFFFGINTAVRLGYSDAFPMIDPLSGKPFAALDPATGPWGAIDQLLVDQCVRGLHFVWPQPLSNRFSQIQLHPSFWRQGDTFAAGAGVGPGLEAIGTESAVMVEPTHSRANNKGLSAPTMLTNMVVASFDDDGNFGRAGCEMSTSNGRVFEIRGDILIEGFGFSVNNIADAASMLWAGDADASFSLRLRGVILNNEPAEDINVSHKKPVPKTLRLQSGL
eukprot:m.136828 g.136828  ORF g.136828 m.136828 type:complete len:538 (+) comp13964_c0_seq1:53-1666(+)